MSKAKRNRRERIGAPPPRGLDAPASGGRHGTAERLDGVGSPRSGARSTRMWRFLGLFVLAVTVYFLVSTAIKPQPPEALAGRPVTGALVRANAAAQHWFTRPYQRGIAQAASALLSFAGYGTRVEDRLIRSDRFAVSIADGCDAIELSLLFVAAVLAVPAGLGRKLVGLVAGLGLVALLNLVRILTLWVIGTHWRGGFEFAHFSLWPFLLVCGTLAVFVGWLRYAVRPPDLSAGAATSGTSAA